MSNMVDYYRILQLPRTATNADIKKAYKRLALKWHPDKNPDRIVETTKRFKEISEAYEVLSDEKKNKLHDQSPKKKSTRRGHDREARRGHDHHTQDRSRHDHHTQDRSGHDHHTQDRSGHDHHTQDRSRHDRHTQDRSRHDRHTQDRSRHDRHTQDRSRHDRHTQDRSGHDHHTLDRSGHDRHTPDRSGHDYHTFHGFSQFGTFPHFFGSNKEFTSISNSSFGNMGMLQPKFVLGFSQFVNISHCLESNQGLASIASSSFGSMGMPAGNVRTTSTSRRFLNDKKIVTEKVEDGLETVTIAEDGVVKSKLVNGDPQAL